jgi:hypothetical protein
MYKGCKETGSSPQTRNRQMTKGAYKVTITKDGTGDFFVLMTYAGSCVPGVRGRYYATKQKAEAAAKKMLAKV